VGRLVKNAGRILPAPVVGAMEQAAAILAAANARAAALVREGEELRAEARRQGYADGRDTAAAELTETLAAAAREAAAVRAQGAPATMQLAGRLAAKMAEKIVGRAVTLAPEIMAEIVAGALASCRPGAGTVRVRIHPDDLAAVEARRAALEAGAPAPALAFVADEAVGRHGCVIETAQGRVDARLETQLAALERALTAGGVRG